MSRITRSTTNFTILTVIIIFTGIIYEIRFTDSQKTSANPVAIGEIAVMSMKEIFLEWFLNREACFAGSAEAFIRSVIVTILWVGISPPFGFSKIRQPVIIIKTTIAISSMGFFIRKACKKIPGIRQSKIVTSQRSLPSRHPSKISSL